MSARLHELLADEALAALAAEHRTELDTMLAPLADAQRDEFMQTAALTQLAFLHRDRPAQQAMPAHIRSRILAAAQAQPRVEKPR